MSSRDGLALLVANVRLGAVQLRAGWPPGVWLVGYLMPETVRMLVFVLIGSVVGGAGGTQFAFVGCFVLAIASASVAHVTDLPVVDVATGTFRTVVAGRLPVVVQYLARALPLVAMALVTACLSTVVIGLVTGQAGLVLPLLSRAWMLLPAAAGAVGLGLLVIAPAIGSSWEGITYNAATAVLTVASGAVFAVDLPLLEPVAGLLPLTHTVDAVRASLGGEPFGGALVRELAVAAGWTALAALAYRRQTRRGRRLGRGAFAA